MLHTAHGCFGSPQRTMATIHLRFGQTYGKAECDFVTFAQIAVCNLPIHQGA